MPLTALLREAVVSTQEICGLLRGRHDVIERVEPVRNVAVDVRRFFELDPAALLAAHRDARAGGTPIAGSYHSHPTGSAEPSPRDAAAAASDGSLWLILGRGSARLWRAVPNGAVHGRFDPVRFDLEMAGSIEKSCVAVHLPDRGGIRLRIERDIAA